MEAVEFIRKIQKMCEGTDCDVCPLNNKNMCNVCYTEDPVESVRIVEEWAAEQERQKAEQERQKAEREQQKPEHPEESSDLHAIIDELEDRFEKLDDKVSYEALLFRALIKQNQAAHRHLADRIAALEKYPVESMNEPKRTNKDVLLALLPNVDTSACPKVLNMNYKCDKRKLCAV